MEECGNEETSVKKCEKIYEFEIVIKKAQREWYQINLPNTYV